MFEKYYLSFLCQAILDTFFQKIIFEFENAMKNNLGGNYENATK